jgi:hypothetical protein
MVVEEFLATLEPKRTPRPRRRLAASCGIGMSAHSRLDRESFQMLLANAFTVQESGMDTQSLFALVEVQRSIVTGDPDVERTMHLIAELALNVANATGIAIALLKAGQLVYRAGSGSAATYVGRHVTAVLNTPIPNEARREILRVENAQTDARIEAAICRQFGARSLLILPIFRESAVAGVLEVLFSEAHSFQDREVRTYRLMAELVEEAIFRDVQLVQKNALATQPATVPHATKQNTSQMQKFCGDDKSPSGPARKPRIGQVRGATTVVADELPGLCPPAKAATPFNQPVKLDSLDKRRWNVAAAAVVIALLVASWIAYDYRSASRVDGSALRRSNAAWQQPTPATAKPFPANRPSPPQTTGGGMGDTNAASLAFRAVRVGQNEVDYIAEDVTIRHFTPKLAPPVRAWSKQVTIGEDVTVRYFAYKPAVVPPTRPASAAAPNR